MFYYILILIAGFIILLKVKEIIAQYRCLEDEEVRDFMTGQLRKDSTAYGRAVAHLGICEKCQQRIHDFDDRKNIEDHLINNDDFS